MNLLVMGGTSFIGRHIVEQAIKQGHEVTLFNRGKTDPGAFPAVRKIIGDRRNDAEKLAGVTWDAVIDTSAYSPADLKPLFKFMKTSHYTFISTVSVYDDFRKGPAKEESSVHTRQVEGNEVTGDTYGPLKVMSEQYIQQKTGGKALIIRPSLVIGPFDPTDRFTYWAIHLENGEQIVVPGSKNRKVQWIDVRDLAEFVVSLVEREIFGTYNAASDPLTMESFIEQVKAGDTEAVWVNDQELLQFGIQPFQFPFWIPISAEYPEGFVLVENKKAKEFGLKFRNLQESAIDTRNWYRAAAQTELKAGISKAKEREILRLIEKNKN